MSEIKNTATTQSYSYELNPTTRERVTKGPISSTSECAVVAPEVTLIKVCEPAYIDLGDEFSVTYTVTNVDKGASGPKFTTVTITDPLFTKTTYVSIVSTTNVSGVINTTTGVATVDLTSVGGKLDPGESVTVTVVFKAIDVPANPSEFVTTATATFKVSEGLTLTATDDCGTIIRNGDLTIDKVVLEDCPVYSGETITYQITITNTGNVDSVIPVGGFTDFPPLSMLTDIALVSPPTGIVFDETKIYNTTTLTIGGGASLVIKFTAKVI